MAVKNTKARIATGATILGLAGLAGVALSANRQQAADVAATKPAVRTKVIHRTIHVTKHAKPRHPRAGSRPRSGGRGHGGLGLRRGDDGLLLDRLHQSSYSPRSRPRPAAPRAPGIRGTRRRS